MAKVMQLNGSFEGPPGKSAYEYAQDGGYTGTEEEFAEKLATNLQLDVTLRDDTKAAPAGMVGKLKGDINQLSEEIANVAYEVDALAALSKCGIITPAYQDGTFYTDEDGEIYTL